MKGRALATVLAVLAIAVAAAPPVFAVSSRGKAQPVITVISADGQSSVVAGGAEVGSTLYVSGENFVKRTAVFVAEPAWSELVETDRWGAFGFAWTPEVTGTHTLVAYQLLKSGRWERAAEVTVVVGR